MQVEKSLLWNDAAIGRDLPLARPPKQVSINPSRGWLSRHLLASLESATEAIISKPVLYLRFKNKKVGSPAWVLLAAVLLAQAQPASTPVLRSFDRVRLLEEKAETSAGVSVGDLNEDGLPDIVLGKGRHWPLFNRVLLNDGHGGFIASNLGTAPDREVRVSSPSRFISGFTSFAKPKSSSLTAPCSVIMMFDGLRSR